MSSYVFTWSPSITYFCLIVSFEHIADTLPMGGVFLNQTGKVTGVMTVVNELVNMLRLALKDAGTDQRVPLLTFPRVRFTSQSRGRDTKPHLLVNRLLFGALPTEPSYLGYHPGQHGHGGESMHGQRAHQLKAKVH